MKNNIFILSLGCTKNLVDSESLIEKLNQTNFLIVDDIDSAGIIIINTCGFIADAKEESINQILEIVELKKERELKIIVFGCLSERYLDNMKKEIPEVDYFFGVNKSDKIVKTVAAIEQNYIKTNICIKKERGHSLKSDKDKKNNKKNNSLIEKGNDLFNKVCPPKQLPKSSNVSNISFLSLNHIGYLKISEGCSNNCSYCAIPIIRGAFSSVGKEEIFSNLDKLLARGVNEIILVGQDTSFYGSDIYKDYFLYNLLLDISDRVKDGWIRLLYTHPAHLTEQVISVIADADNICNYIDLPLQHINNRILSAMGRKIDKSQIISLINKIKKKNIAIRTSFIVGFPGETEEEFQELLDFIKQVEFERLGVFKYSQEEDTLAFDYKDQIDEYIKEERFSKILLAQQKISKKINLKLAAKTVKVIIDGVDEFDSNFLLGRTMLDAPDIDCLVHIENQTNNINAGDIVSVKITEAEEYDLFGEVQ